MSIFYIPPKQTGDWQGAFDSIAAQVREIKSTHMIDEQKLQTLEQEIEKKGVKLFDYEATYAKDDVVLYGPHPNQTWFFSSLRDNNKGRFPDVGQPYWVILAGKYEPVSIAGVDSTDIASVTSAIKSGSLDHPESLTVGETAPIVNIGTGANPKTINLGGAGDTVAVAGNLVTVHTDNLQVKDSLLRLNRDGLSGSAADAGIEIEEAGAVAAYMKTNGSRNGFVFKAPASSEIALNQSVATNSSPSFQTLTTSSPIQAGGNIHTNGFLRVQAHSNPVGVGSYVAHGSGGMPGACIFMNQPGANDGGWRWIIYGSNNAWLSDAMSLTRSGGLTVNGSLTSSNMKATNGFSISGWNSAALQTNDAFIGRNRTSGTGMMSFACNRGNGSGGFEWVSYDTTGTLENIPMTLTRHGDLSLARHATVNGNLTVNGTINASNVPTVQTTSLFGLWQGAFSGLAGGIYVRKFGPMVTVEIDYFDLNATHATNEGVFSELLPTWARPAVAGNYPLSFAVPFLNGTATIARLYISSERNVNEGSGVPKNEREYSCVSCVCLDR